VNATLVCPGTVHPNRYPDAVPENEPIDFLRGRARVHWQQLVDGLAGAELSGDPSVEVTDLTHDSRRVAVQREGGREAEPLEEILAVDRVDLDGLAPVLAAPLEDVGQAAVLVAEVVAGDHDLDHGRSP
jgi:hypothetical protein